MTIVALIAIFTYIAWGVPKKWTKFHDYLRSEDLFAALLATILALAAGGVLIGEVVRVVLKGHGIVEP